MKAATTTPNAIAKAALDREELKLRAVELRHKRAALGAIGQATATAFNFGHGSAGNPGTDALTPIDRSYRNAAPDAGSPWGESVGGSMDAHMAPFRIGRMRRASQWLRRNNGLARGMIRQLGLKVLGPDGLLVNVNIAKERTLSEEIEGRFHEDMDRADIRQLMGWNELQHCWYRSQVWEGDHLVSMVGGGRPEDLFLLQSIVAERIGGNWFDRRWVPGKPHGVTVDRVGRPVSYQVVDFGPGGQTDKTITNIRAEDAVFFAFIDDASQTRGEPRLAASIDRFMQLDAFIESTGLAAYIATLFAAIHLSDNPRTAQSLAPGRNIRDADGTVQKETHLRPGMFLHGGKGDDLKGFKPEQPTTQFAEYLRMQVRMIGLDIGLPLELAMLDYSQTVFHSARAARQDADDGFAYERKRMGRRLSVIFERWLSWRVRCGEFKGLPVGRVPHNWIGPKRASFDPVKEMIAAKIAKDENFAPLRALCMELGGYEWLSVFDQRKEERDLEREFEIQPPSMKGSEANGAGGVAGSMSDEATTTSVDGGGAATP